MDTEESITPDKVARHFFEVIPPLWHSMSSALRYGGEERAQVTFPQIRAMAILRHHRASLNDLANAHDVSPATMSRMISTLVERGWVQREEDPADRRQIRLTLTKAGETSMNAIGTRSVEYLSEVLQELSPDELSSLEHSLKALARVVQGLRPSALPNETTSTASDIE